MKKYWVVFNERSERVEKDEAGSYNKISPQYTITQAEYWAEKLAKEYPGTTFTVLEAKSKFVVDGLTKETAE